MTASSGLGLAGAILVLALLVTLLRPHRVVQPKAPPLNQNGQLAEAWLASQGYAIVRGRQEAEWIGYHDKDEFRKRLSVDYVVRQGANYYAVKLTQTPDIEVSGLRLREEWYPLWNAFGVRGIIQLDVYANQAHTIDFEVKKPRYVSFRRWGANSGWMVAGAFLMFAWLHRIS